MLVNAAGTFRCSRQSVAPCTTFTHLLRVVCWTQPSRTSPSCSGDQPEYGYERASLVLLWPLSPDHPKASRAEINTPAHLQPPLRWPGASWSVGTSRLRHACTDRPVSMSGGACACDRRIKRSSRSAHGCLREHHRGFLSFSRLISKFWHMSVSCLRDLCLILDDRLRSAPSPLCS